MKPSKLSTDRKVLSPFNFWGTQKLFDDDSIFTSESMVASG